MQTKSQDLIDPDEPCHTCYGKGFKSYWEPSDYGTGNVQKSEACYACRGTGRQTVRVDA